MKIVQAFLFLVMILIAPGCNAEITGTVVDAETGAPIERAVVLVEWIITKGLPGMTYHETYKVIETITDKEGMVAISGVFNPLVDPPDVTIYKKGYVAWNSAFIFPDYKKRTDFKWQHDYIFKLEKFRPEYSYIAHTRFIRSAIHSGMALGKKDLIKRAFEWEDEMAFQERRRKEAK
jgi:hypothetical protein